MIIALWAALAMVCQDIIAVPLTQAEARNRAVLSGLLDGAGWLVAITTTFLSVNALQGHSLSTKIWVIVLVSIANLVGSYLGCKIGERWVKDDQTTTANRLKVLETHLGIESPDVFPRNPRPRSKVFTKVRNPLPGPLPEG
jgi:hypothetical protein